jgi:DNA-binding CsgD family transcriptional regulator
VLALLRQQRLLAWLVGREQEVDLLLSRWSLTRDGEGQVVLLSGEPGIGKSRILSTLRERLEAQRAQSLRFQCSPYYVNSAFWPVIDNLERALTFTRDETTDWLGPTDGAEQTRHIGITIERRVPRALALRRRVEDLPLTGREKQLCLLLAHDRSRQDLADAMGLSTGTIITHQSKHLRQAWRA